MRVAAILVAAGSGSRFGADVAKQFLPLAGKLVIRHAAEALAAHVDLLQPVGDAAAIAASLAGLPHLTTVAGGATRQDSVRAGLEALAPHAPDLVLVHDAARPLIPPGTIPALLAALQLSAGAIPAAPVADTLKRVANGLITATVPRDGLYRAQTPQAFRFPTLLAAHRAGAGAAATDDAALLEAAGEPVAIVPGSDDNIKLTYAEDLPRLERAMTAHLIPRVGTGFDVHVLAADRPLMLCGVAVPHDKGLAGHSDADVGNHARGRHRPPLPTLAGYLEGRRQRPLPGARSGTDRGPRWPARQCRRDADLRTTEDLAARGGNGRATGVHPWRRRVAHLGQSDHHRETRLHRPR
jgi:2-C-methyl-D-erythritol 4-phosphate cytidylyltransferase/2-C-methyl-D-erythritol 2,4-cyclodiphosphate synthase